ncbi:MAG: hypothetical protein ACLGH0_01890, partial [Thermoanaerobaculia bacterium]
MHTRVVALLFPLIIGPALVAAPVVITPVPVGNLEIQELELTAERVGGPETVTIVATTDKPQTTDLQTGLWRLRTATAGTWTPPVVIDVREAPLDVRLLLFPTTTVTARLGFAKGERPATELNVYLQRTPDDSTSSLQGEHTVTCAVKGVRATCELPAGTYDLAFRVPGFISVYDWGRRIAGRRADLGVLQFRRGTTVSGWVDIATLPDGDTAAVDVVLAPLEDPHLNDEQRLRAALAALTVKPSRRGFFHFVVAPGAYTVTALTDRHRSRRHQLVATAGEETVLRERLRLEENRELTINIQPKLHPAGRPWTVIVDDETGGDRHSATASADGVARFKDLLPVRYRLTIGGDEDFW